MSTETQLLWFVLGVIVYFIVVLIALEKKNHKKHPLGYPPPILAPNSFVGYAVRIDEHVYLIIESEIWYEGPKHEPHIRLRLKP